MTRSEKSSFNIVQLESKILRRKIFYEEAKKSDRIHFGKCVRYVRSCLCTNHSGDHNGRRNDPGRYDNGRHDDGCHDSSRHDDSGNHDSNNNDGRDHRYRQSLECMGLE